MYNDEKNLYHYTYRRDGSEDHRTPTQGQTPVINASYREPWEENKSGKKSRLGVKIAALALTCALIGGGAGAGITWSLSRGGNATDVNISARPITAVSLKSVDGKTAMTDAEVYAANVNSVVSINSTTATNYFGQTVQSASAGSGFVLTADGYIVTNYHVVQNSSALKVTLYNGESYEATVIGGDEDYDIAVIKVEATGLQPVTLGDSDSLNVGDRVLAIGNPLGELTFSMSEGIASSVNRAINVDGTPFNMIQVTASINPGNSGGPLLNNYGEVVGIVSAKYSSYSNTTVEGLGFAIPINDVLAMIQDIMTNGYVTNKPYLGITAMTMNQQLAAQFRYDIAEGVFISALDEGGAADTAGLQRGDVITKIDNTSIATMEDLTAVKKQYSAGDTATFTIYRDGATLTVEVTWDAMPAQADTREDTTIQQPAQQPGNSYNGGMEDFFNYFFGNRYAG